MRCRTDSRLRQGRSWSWSTLRGARWPTRSGLTPCSATRRSAGLPREVDPVLIRGMAKAPEARFGTAGEFVAALKEALDGPPTEMTRPIASRQPLAAPGAALAPGSLYVGSRRSGRLMALAALLLVAAGVALVGILGQSGSKTPSGAKRAASAKVTRAPAHHRARAKSHHRAASAHHQAASASTSAGASTTATSSSVAAPPSSATAPSAAGLQAQGHQELADGSYSSAIS